MANVKMTFMVEVDGEAVIRHQVEILIYPVGSAWRNKRPSILLLIK